MRVVVLGAAGMLGNAMFRVLSEHKGWEVFGTIRSDNAKHYFASELTARLMLTDDLEDHAQLVKLVEEVRPQVVVNCVALRRTNSIDPMRAISVFSILPQRLAHLCRLANVRLVQISSDGVFSGSRGGYTEEDLPDATDLYGIAKLLGEVRDPHAITLRTSIIGHEIETKDNLLEWFLSQKDRCRCFTRAIFSGLPTVVLAQIVRDVVIPRPGLSGVYHVAASPISKFDLLSVVSRQYKKSIVIVPDSTVAIDRSLIADRFQRATGYVPPSWSQLVRTMHSYRFGLART